MSNSQWLVFFLIVFLAVLVLYRNNKLTVNPLLKSIVQAMFSKPGLSSEGNQNG